MNYNYKLRSVFGQKDDSKATKWTWFNKQVRDTFLCSWIISRALIDYTNMGRAMGYTFDKVYAPSVSMSDNIESTTLFFHTSMVLYPGLIIIYVYVNLYMKACYLRYQRNNRMERFH